jgi:biopolymer transport protein ExbD
MKLFRRPRHKPHIDMTPLIDCVFTLTIVILMAATFQRLHLMQMKLPEAGTQDNPEGAEILVAVDAQGRYFLGIDRIDPVQLESRLKPLIDKSKRRVVTFQGDPRIEYQWFVRVLDAARAAGAEHIDVAHTLPPKR